MGGRSKAVLIVFGFAMLAIVSIAFFSFFTPASAIVIKQGARGETVRTIQENLKKQGYDPGPADGVFGIKTKAAVKEFQRNNKLTADGVVGQKTAELLGVSLSGPSVTVSPADINDSDLQLMARTVYGEARGESYTGKVAVAAVIINRVKSKEFPSTVAGVIYQPWAFTAVTDGQINLGADEECLNACRDALNGWDPTHGCLYYYNPEIATCEWIRTRPMVITIGNHVFCK